MSTIDHFQAAHRSLEELVRRINLEKNELADPVFRSPEHHMTFREWEGRAAAATEALTIVTHHLRVALGTDAEVEA